ncbi:CHAD domain-containing protein [Tunturiibacter lichenicola]|uniref:CHAD domain-containing protein n=1 Tax=Tunturiibacter lichenicola TaxID=2051959 RepID=UPI003D9AD1B5
MPQPVATFLAHSLSLKTAMAECLANPTPKSVHWLRATIRRIEATLDLLIDTADLPTLPRQSKQFRRSLRRIRRAAGAVRDLDVHCELLATYKTISDATVLEKDLTVLRGRKQKKLQQHIQGDARDILAMLDKLEPILAPAAELDLSGGSLAHAARALLAPALRGLDPSDDEGLHSIRKACKSARYIAEIGCDVSKSAATLAKRLIDLQQTIGAWHDHLLLLNEAETALPTDSPLTEKLYVKTRILRRKAKSKAVRLLARKASTPSRRTSDVH